MPGLAPSVLLSDEMILFVLVCVYQCCSVIRRTVLVGFSVYLFQWVIMQLYNSATQPVLHLASESTLSFFALWLVSVTHETVPCVLL